MFKVAFERKAKFPYTIWKRNEDHDNRKRVIVGSETQDVLRPRFLIVVLYPSSCGDIGKSNPS